ncbi:MAG: PH domain-containing protein [Jatrophihabitantaceae bacterium]
MDDVTEPRPAARVQFGPDRRLTAAGAGAAAVALVLCLTTGDGPGRVLWALAALVLAGYVVGDLVWWPRLAADATGLRIRTPFTRCDLPWSEVANVRADVRSRYGLRSTSLEVDAEATLVVFSRRSLGEDPESVADAVRMLRPAG